MNRKNFKTEILEKIKSGKIEQKSKWYFLTKSYVFWFFTALSTFLGSFAFASTLFQLSENKRAFTGTMNPTGMIRGFAEALPYWWVLAFLIFLVIAYVNYKSTYKSYTQESIYIIFISILISIVLGFIIFYAGLAKKMEYKARDFFPEYRSHIEHRKHRVGEFLRKNGYSRQDMKDPKVRNEVRGLIESIKHF